LQRAHQLGDVLVRRPQRCRGLRQRRPAERDDHREQRRLLGGEPVGAQPLVHQILQPLREHQDGSEGTHG